MVATRVDVDGRGEGLNIQSLFDAPTNPVMFGTKDSDILLAKMMAVFASMLNTSSNQPRSSGKVPNAKKKVCHMMQLSHTKSHRPVALREPSLSEIL